MHIQLDRIEIIITYQCNSNCRHCLIQPALHHGETMDPDTARKYIEVLGNRYHPYSIMIFGGEPILVLPSVIAALDMASRLKIPQRQLLTNGNWIKRPNSKKNTSLSEEEQQQFRIIALRLKQAGLNAVEISMDVFHEECLELEQSLFAAQVLVEAQIENIGISPRWIRSSSDPHPFNKRTHEILQIAAAKHIKIFPGEPIQPRGNALFHFQKDFPIYQVLDSAKCNSSTKAPDFRNIRGICVSPIGDAIICNNIIIGQTTPENILYHLDQYRPENYPEIKIICEEGLQGFKRIAKTKNIDLPSGPFYSLCDACFQFRKALGFRNICNA